MDDEGGGGEATRAPRLELTRIEGAQLAALQRQIVARERRLAKQNKWLRWAESWLAAPAGVRASVRFLVLLVLLYGLFSVLMVLGHLLH
jgi:hypothetical protein